MWATLHCILRVTSGAHVYLDKEDVMISKCGIREANENVIKCLSEADECQSVGCNMMCCRQSVWVSLSFTKDSFLKETHLQTDSLPPPPPNMDELFNPLRIRCNLLASMCWNTPPVF